MRKTKQVLALLLAVAMSISLLSTEALAARGNSKQSVTDEVMEQEIVDNQSHRLETTPDGQIVDEWETFQIPDIIEKEEVDEKGYIGRDFESEKDLNTFVFKNSDGSNTMRIYDYPVKYVDNNGDIKDITTDIEKGTDGAYITKDNAIKTRFPKYFGEGIELTSDNVNIELVPKGMDNISKYASTSIPVQAVDDKTVSYYYGINTTLEYELTYTGFKEDIVVSEYTGQTEYDFTICTNGLYLSEEDGSYYLVDDEGTVQATIGDIIIFTADEANNTMGSMTSVTIEDGQEYLLTIHVDAEYLKDKKTVYPIRIDPTIEVNYDNNGAGAIEDVTINSGSGSSGSSGSMYVGKRSTYGISRTLMKFPTLDLSVIYSQYEITSATVEVRDLLCQTEGLEVYCHIFTGNIWTEASANWSNVNPNSYVSSYMSSRTVSYANGKSQSVAHRYSFDITGAVRGWKSGTYSKEKGIVFKASSTIENGSTYVYKTFASYNRASYKPSLSVTFTEKISLSLSVSDKYIKVGNTRTIEMTKVPTTLGVTWSSGDTSIATVDSSGVVTGVSQGSVSIYGKYFDTNSRQWYTKSVLLNIYDSSGIVEGQAYYIMNASSGKYMSLDTLSETNGTNVTGRVRGKDACSSWNIAEVADGKFRLKNCYGSAINALTASGSNISVFSYKEHSSQHFRIERVYSGDFKGLYLIIYGNYYVTHNTTTNNIYLTLTLSDAAYWSFMAIPKRNADYFSFDVVSEVQGENIQSAKHNTAFENAFEYYGFKTQTFTNKLPSDLKERLNHNLDILMYAGHGSPGRLAFVDDINFIEGSVLTNSLVRTHMLDAGYANIGRDVVYIDELEHNALGNARCIIYIACESALDYEAYGKKYNLMESTFNKGAHFVMAVKNVVGETDVGIFTSMFISLVNDENSRVQDIMSLVEKVLVTSVEVSYIGDTYQYLK